MNLCECGSSVQPGSMRCPRCSALYALDLEMNATEAEIRRSYRLLVKVWHPDRFQNDEKLKEAAEKKLQDINSAFEFLTSTTDERGPWRPPSRPATEGDPSPFQAQSASGDSASTQPPAGAPIPVVMPDLTPRSRLWPALKIGFKAVAVLFALLLCRYLWIAFDAPDPTGGDVARVYDKGKQSILKGTEGPRARFIDAIERDWHRIVPYNSKPDLSETQQSAPSASQQPEQAAPQKTTASRTDRYSTARSKLLPYITVGSTRDEVLAQQGTPTASTEDKLVYGKSELYLKSGAVAGWRIDPASPIRVKLWPSTAVDPSLAFYSIGSTKDAVLKVQGTPTVFTEDKFEYGKSVVLFRNNRVVSWKEDPDSTPLWAR